MQSAIKVVGLLVLICVFMGGYAVSGNDGQVVGPTPSVARSSGSSSNPTAGAEAGSKSNAAAAVAVNSARKPRSVKTNDSYVVKAGGPNTFNLITNLPALNKARIELTRPQQIYDRVAFTVTNAEPAEILLWNVRVQVKSPGENGGTDGFGWDTVYDDYPESKDAIVKSGRTTQLTVKPPTGPLWRVCLLYAKGRTNEFSEKVYGGNYEIISEPIDEATLDKVDPRQ